MSDPRQESKAALEFREWFAANGGFIHPSIHFKQVDSGLSVCASDAVPADEIVMTCPFALAITPALCTAALTSAFGTPAVHAQWTEKQLICAYVCLHWALRDAPPALAHRAYLGILPGRDKLRTPLHFTEAESRAFKGTNLYGTAVEARRAEWQREWQDCQRDIAAHDAAAGEGFTWERYLTAATYLSSRAFPSTILSAAPSLQRTPASHPVLLPGIDSLNHARAAPVSWVVSNTVTNGADIAYIPDIANMDIANLPNAATAAALAVNLVLHRATPAGAELLNNYGPKPNAELILGYGFALPANPSDTIVLQIGVGGGGGGGGGGAAGGAQTQTQAQEKQKQEQKKLEVGRNARGAEAVWDEVLALVASSAAETTYEDELEAAGVLGDMLLALQDRLPDVENVESAKADGGIGGIRPEVQEMLEYYVEGQRDILRALLAFAQGKEKAAIEAARAQGIDLVFEDDAEVVGDVGEQDVDGDEDDSDEADEADEQYQDA